MVFLPLCVVGYAIVASISPRRWALAWLLMCSLAYYGWWDPRYLILLSVSILVNFSIGRWLSATRNTDRPSMALAHIEQQIGLKLLTLTV